MKSLNLSPLAAWIVFSSALTLDRQIVADLITEILNDKRLIVYWLSLLTIVISLPLIFPKSFFFSNQNSLRKFYHFASVALFVPAAFWSFNVLRIALAVASTLFIYTETIRNDLKEKFKGNAFNEFMERCRNELDCGEMILSHFYLLLGCSLPFWLDHENSSLKIHSFSGIISLGIGDSLASIGGKCFGRHKWHSRTSKTLEGSFCAWMGMVIAWIILNELCEEKISFKKLFFISFASALWEALINLNDNLTLPLFTFLIFNKTL